MTDTAEPDWQSALLGAVHPGDLIAGTYRIERLAGASAMGVVLEARHVELGKRVAIEFLRPARLASPKVRHAELAKRRRAAGG